MKDQIINSSAFKSFTFELATAKAFEKRKWVVVNSCHYLDLKQDKVREIDAVASLCGVRRRKKYAVSRIHVVLECKTMRGFHILANKWHEELDDKSDTLKFSWYGTNKQNKTYLFKVLAEKNIPAPSLNVLYRHFNSWFHPNQPRRIFPLCLPSFSLGPECSGFREMNIGNEKDLDNSVLWRANLALKSAIESFNREKSEEFKTELDDLLMQFKASDFPKANKEVIKHLDVSSNLVDSYHPVIVTDAKLWAIENDNVVEKPAIRLYQREFLDIFGDSWWVDVVTYDYLDKYVTKLDRHYRKMLRQRNMRIYL